MEDPNTAFNWPSSACQRRVDYGITLNVAFVALRFSRGSGPVLQRNPIDFVIFQGGGPHAPPPSGSAHVCCCLYLLPLRGVLIGPLFCGAVSSSAIILLMSKSEPIALLL